MGWGVRARHGTLMLVQPIAYACGDRKGSPFIAISTARILALGLLAFNATCLHRRRITEQPIPADDLTHIRSVGRGDTAYSRQPVLRRRGEEHGRMSTGVGAHSTQHQAGRARPGHGAVRRHRLSSVRRCWSASSAVLVAPKPGRREVQHSPGRSATAPLRYCAPTRSISTTSNHSIDRAAHRSSERLRGWSESPHGPNGLTTLQADRDYSRPGRDAPAGRRDDGRSAEARSESNRAR
jgi:hypothetical protein